ncbi:MULTISPECIES: hypothetical protein [Kitasatospora]|uniref:Uncharacterized protein n=1 Tax=Kitasatospora cystarginea TaxID=58350 RepID=A0ABN3EVK0_9ACTN
MRALFLTWPWGCHLFPMVPFEWALSAAGYDLPGYWTAGTSIVGGSSRANGK